MNHDRCEVVRCAQANTRTKALLGSKPYTWSSGATSRSTGRSSRGCGWRSPRIGPRPGASRRSLLDDWHYGDGAESDEVANVMGEESNRNLEQLIVPGDVSMLRRVLETMAAFLSTTNSKPSALMSLTTPPVSSSSPSGPRGAGASPLPTILCAALLCGGLDLDLDFSFRRERRGSLGCSFPRRTNETDSEMDGEDDD